MRTFMAGMVSICLFLQGCTSLQAVVVPGEAAGRVAVEIGETVEVTTRTGQEQRFRVTEVADDALVGNEVRIAYVDMASLQALRPDKGKTMTVWAVVGVVLIVALVAALGQGCYNCVE
jgi:hypothetical protein